MRRVTQRAQHAIGAQAGAPPGPALRFQAEGSGEWLSDAPVWLRWRAQQGFRERAQVLVGIKLMSDGTSFTIQEFRIFY